jgi:hypothetical protein
MSGKSSRRARSRKSPRSIPFFDGEETRKEMKEEKKKRNKILMTGDDENIAVGRKLDGCRKSARCKSPACPVCNFKERRKWIRGLLSLLEEHGTIYAATIVPNKLIMKPLGLRQVNIDQVKDTLRQQIVRVGLNHAIIAGGVEVVYREKMDRVLVHLHLIIADCTRAEIEELRHFYKSEAGGVRQLYVEEIDNGDRPKVFSYCHKHRTYAASEIGRKPYRPPPEIEIPHLMFLDRHTFSELIFRKGFRQGRDALIEIPRTGK